MTEGDDPSGGRGVHEGSRGVAVAGLLHGPLGLTGQELHEVVQLPVDLLVGGAVLVEVGVQPFERVEYLPDLKGVHAQKLVDAEVILGP
ncbi:hypothetical protein [Streptomyces lavendulae]|uniref:hypothetical protein n=1 Tax=Streptomyces lavendulae TaxID=1914 RepID=UPI002556A02F|nr:hypothetical protein [Streptomyces lavendulae]